MDGDQLRLIWLALAAEEIRLAGADGGWTIGEVIVRLAFLLRPPYEAVTTTEVLVATLPAVTLKVVEAEPWGTSTVGGTFAALEFELASETVTPPAPAFPVRLTVPVAVWPPVIELGLTDMPLSATGAGLTVTPNVLFTPRYEAVKVTEVGVVTLAGVTLKVVEVVPWGTSTVEGTFAALEFELASETVTPPAPAIPERLTVPVAV